MRPLKPLKVSGSIFSMFSKLILESDQSHPRCIFKVHIYGSRTKATTCELLDGRALLTNYSSDSVADKHLRSTDLRQQPFLLQVGSQKTLHKISNFMFVSFDSDCLLRAMTFLEDIPLGSLHMSQTRLEGLNKAL